MDPFERIAEAAERLGARHPQLAQHADSVFCGLGLVAVVFVFGILLGGALK